MNADKTFYLLRGIGFVNDFSEINNENPGSLEMLSLMN